jgi:hypothetical protein
MRQDGEVTRGEAVRWHVGELVRSWVNVLVLYDGGGGG